MNDEQIKYMVDRFLAWRLSENFRPDAGISFRPEFNVEYNASQGRPPQRHEPTGTNLLDATQAEAMMRYLIEGMPEARRATPDSPSGVPDDVQKAAERFRVFLNAGGKSDACVMARYILSSTP